MGRELASVLTEITLLYVIDAEEQKFVSDSGSDPPINGSQNDLLLNRIKRLRQIRKTELPDITLVNLAISVGDDAAEVICRGAKRYAAKMILLTSHWQSERSECYPGAVADAVVGRAPCPVMIVRPRASASVVQFASFPAFAQAPAFESPSAVPKALKKTGTNAS